MLLVVDKVNGKSIVFKTDRKHLVRYDFGTIFYKVSEEVGYVFLIPEDDIPEGTKVYAQRSEDGKLLYINKAAVKLTDMSVPNRLFQYFMNAEIEVGKEYYIARTPVGPQFVTEDGFGRIVKNGVLIISRSDYNLPLPPHFMSLGENLYKVTAIGGEVEEPVITVTPTFKKKDRKYVEDDVEKLARIFGYSGRTARGIASIIVQSDFADTKLTSVDVQSTATFCDWVTRALKNAFEQEYSDSRTSYGAYLHNFYTVAALLFGDKVGKYLVCCLEAGIKFDFETVVYDGEDFIITLQDGKALQDAIFVISD